MPNQAPLHEGIEASGGTVIQALTFGICLRRLVNFTARRLYPWYPFSRRLGGPQSWSRDFKEEKNFFPGQESSGQLHCAAALPLVSTQQEARWVQETV